MHPYVHPNAQVQIYLLWCSTLKKKKAQQSHINETAYISQVFSPTLGSGSTGQEMEQVEGKAQVIPLMTALNLNEHLHSMSCNFSKLTKRIHFRDLFCLSTVFPKVLFSTPPF